MQDEVLKGCVLYAYLIWQGICKSVVTTHVHMVYDKRQLQLPG